MANNDTIEYICEIPKGATIKGWGKRMFVSHPDYPLQEVDFINKCLVEVKLSSCEISNTVIDLGHEG